MEDIRSKNEKNTTLNKCSLSLSKSNENSSDLMELAFVGFENNETWLTDSLLPKTIKTPSETIKDIKNLQDSGIFLNTNSSSEDVPKNSNEIKTTSIGMGNLPLSFDVSSAQTPSTSLCFETKLLNGQNCVSYALNNESPPHSFVQNSMNFQNVATSDMTKHQTLVELLNDNGKCKNSLDFIRQNAIDETSVGSLIPITPIQTEKKELSVLINDERNPLDTTLAPLEQSVLLPLNVNNGAHIRSNINAQETVLIGSLANLTYDLCEKMNGLCIETPKRNDQSESNGLKNTTVSLGDEVKASNEMLVDFIRNEIKSIESSKPGPSYTSTPQLDKAIEKYCKTSKLSFLQKLAKESPVNKNVSAAGSSSLNNNTFDKSVTDLNEKSLPLSKSITKARTCSGIPRPSKIRKSQQKK